MEEKNYVPAEEEADALEEEDILDEEDDASYSGWNCNENVIEFLRGQKTATVTLCNKRLKNRVYKFQQSKPDEVEIISDKDGALYAHIPVSWIRIIPPQKREYTEEERAQLAKRLRDSLNKKKEGDT